MNNGWTELNEILSREIKEAWTREADLKIDGQNNADKFLIGTLLDITRLASIGIWKISAMDFLNTIMDMFNSPDRNDPLSNPEIYSARLEVWDLVEYLIEQLAFQLEVSHAE